MRKTIKVTHRPITYAINVGGRRGVKGDPGPANSLSIGTVTEGAANASITGNPPTQTLNLTLPRGNDGQPGAAGPSNTLSIGTVTGGDTAGATITGTSPSQTLNLTLPKGDKGDKGEEGPDGPAGQDGLVTSIGAGENITVDDTDPANPIVSAIVDTSVEWGDITGDISDQTDINDRFNSYDASIETNATDINNHVSNTSNPHSVTKTQVGLGNVPNLNTTTAVADAHTHSNKSILDATTASFTTADENKLDGIAAGAEVNVNADWNSASGDSQILNKPTIPAQFNPIAGTNMSLSGSYPNITFNASGGGGSGAIESIVAGDNITIDDTDPANPVISSTGGITPAGFSEQSPEGESPETLIRHTPQSIRSYHEVDGVIDLTGAEFSGTNNAANSFSITHGAVQGRDTTNGHWYRVSSDSITYQNPELGGGSEHQLSFAGDNGYIATREYVTDQLPDPADFATAAQGALADTAVQNLTDLGLTASATELNYVDGVTSNIQTQLNSKTSNTGTVTSVGLTTPTGLTTTGSPVTTSGTIAVTYTAGYQGYTSTEASKLSNIEANADVTDAANVAAAGALMSTGAAKITVGTTTPSSPAIGDLWVDTN